MEPENVIQRGICCDVTNCVYNNGCHCCTADQVHVKNRIDQPEKTVCETFSEI